MSKIAATRVAYFGKVPSRGDFIKSGENHRLLSTLDGWLDGAPAPRPPASPLRAAGRAGLRHPVGTWLP